MQVIVVLDFEINKPDDVVPIMEAINPPLLPFFKGEARISVDPYAQHVIDFLDGGEPQERKV